MIDKQETSHFTNLAGLVRSQVFRFAVAGSIGAFIEIGLYHLLTTSYEIHYLIASTISTLSAILVNYLISRVWVFETGRHLPFIEVILFLFVSITVIGLNQFFMWVFVDLLNVGGLISKALAIVFAATVNFFLKKKIVFKG